MKNNFFCVLLFALTVAAVSFAGTYQARVAEPLRPSACDNALSGDFTSLKAMRTAAIDGNREVTEYLEALFIIATGRADIVEAAK